MRCVCLLAPAFVFDYGSSVLKRRKTQLGFVGEGTVYIHTRAVCLHKHLDWRISTIVPRKMASQYIQAKVSALTIYSLPYALEVG